MSILNTSEDPTVDEKNIHLQNYRIAFDAMRAYHVSEIEHKKDMITILNSILVTIVTVYAGIFYIIVDEKYKSIIGIMPICSLIISFIYWLLIDYMLGVNVKKLTTDNDRYERFRIECLLERDYLGLTNYFENLGDNSYGIYWRKKVGPRKEEAIGKEKKKNIQPVIEERVWTGYKETIKIIEMYSYLLKFITVALTIISIIASFNLV